jgi:hypothetical protein
MSYGKTKTLELGLQDWEENNKIDFKEYKENNLHGTKCELVGFE